MRALLIVLVLVATNAAAVEYKCKDAQGNWSTTACTGAAAPPPKPVGVARKTKPEIGMTADEARMLPIPWGEPRSVRKHESASGIREQWIYGPNYRPSYLYFDDGVLTSISE